MAGVYPTICWWYYHFIEHDMQKALNTKLILCIFEQLSGLKINFHKSEIFLFSKAKVAENDYRIFFGCDLGFLPFRYLGIPTHYRKLTNSEWKLIDDIFERKKWVVGLEIVVLWDRLVLINSVLTSLPMFMFSFPKIPEAVKKRILVYRSIFSWQSDEHKKRYSLTKWNISCRPKDQWGLGVKVLGLKNKSLLSKWLFKLMN
jgi:hypothetical protein